MKSHDAVPVMGALVKAVGDGDLTPTEAAELTKMVQAFAKIIETAELEERSHYAPASGVFWAQLWR